MQPHCPVCNHPFNNWDCQACGYKLPQNKRKFVPKVLSENEASDVRKRLGLDNKKKDLS